MPYFRATARRLTGPVCLSVLLVGSLAACGRQEAAQPAAGGGMPPLPVTALEAQPTTAPIALELVGQTEGAREVEVRARVGGILEQRLYDEGAAVKAGQPLFRIDPEPLKIAVAQAEAELAQAKARAEQTRREADRLTGLLAQEAVSRKEQEDAVSNAALAAAALQAAEAKLRQAELNLSYTTVTAPVAGITDQSVPSEGALVSASGPDSLLTRIYQVNPIRVSFALPFSELAQVPGGQLTAKTVRGVQLVLPGGQVYEQKGRLDFSASAVDPRLGTLQLRAEFANPEQRVMPGQFVRVRLLVGEQKDVFKVPQQAVMQSEQGNFVYVIADGKAAARPVQAGEWQGRDWIITAGLKSGDQVIVDNLMKVRPGAPVQIAPADAAPAGAPGVPAK